MNNLKSTFETFVQTLHMYDYILFGACVTLFFLLLLIAIIARNKVGLSLFLVLISFSTLLAGPIVAYKYIHSTLYKTEIKDLKINKLEFSQAIVIKGDLINLGKENFRQCTISSSVYKQPTNFIEELVLPFKPFLKRSVILKEELNISNSMEFKMILEPFTYTKDYNISVKVNCI